MDPESTRPGSVSEVPQFVAAQEQAWQYIGYATIGCQLQIYFCGVVLGVASLSSALSSASRALKAFLATIVITNVAFTGFVANRLTPLATEQHRDMSFILSPIGLSNIPTQLLYTLITISSQMFFAIRVIRVLGRQLDKSIWLTTFVFLILASLAGCTGVVQAEIKSFITRRTESNVQGYNLFKLWGLPVTLATAAVADVLISVTLAVCLGHSILGFNTHTDSTLRRVIRTTLATGALTAVTASIGAATTLMYNTGLLSNYAMDIFIYPLPSLYCLSVFWTLNLRSRLRRERQGRAIEFSLAAPMSDGSRAVACGQRTPPKVSLPNNVVEVVPIGSEFRQPNQSQSGS